MDRCLCSVELADIHSVDDMKRLVGEYLAVPKDAARKGVAQIVVDMRWQDKGRQDVEQQDMEQQDMERWVDESFAGIVDKSQLEREHSGPVDSHSQ